MAGYRVTVISATYLAWAREADKIFNERGWKIVNPVPFGPTAPVIKRLIQVLRQRLATWVVSSGIRTPNLLCAAWHQAAPDLAAAARRVAADLYVAHYPSALPAAARAARRHGALYAFDAEDFHSGDTPSGPAYEARRSVLQDIERLYLAGCAYVTAASPGIADAYVETYGLPRPKVVLNAFPTTRTPGGPTDRGDASPGPSLYWFSQTIGPDRGLECAVKALAVSHCKPHLYLRGIAADGFLDKLTSLAKSLGVTNRLHILPPAAPDEMENLAAEYDVGYSGEPGHTANNCIALGNKLFTYLMAGIPIIASDIPSHVNLSRNLGAAMSIFKRENPAHLAKILDDILGDPPALKTARHESFRQGRTRYNWNIEQKTVIKCAGAALHRRSHAATRERSAF